MTSWLEISRSNLFHNVHYFRKLLNPQTKLLAVVKGNAYGHGQEQIVSLLKNNKEVSGFAVFELAEALTIRQQTKKPIVVLGYWPQELNVLRRAAKANISLAVKNFNEAQYLKKLGIKIPIQIKIDIGTRRLGIDYHQAVREVKKIQALKHLTIQGIFSHFADSENNNQTFTQLQFRRFLKIILELDKADLHFPLNHIACTAAILRQPLYQFQALRLGLGLYGLQPFANSQSGGLKAVLSWKTRILQIRPVKPGDTVGYGQSYQVKRHSYIASLPVGYYDGYDRKLSNNAEVLIAGRRYPVVGRICMNVMMVELPMRHRFKSNQLVTLLGHDGNETITADELAKRQKSINYEMVTRINPLLPRLICS